MPSERRNKGKMVIKKHIRDQRAKKTTKNFGKKRLRKRLLKRERKEKTIEEKIKLKEMKTVIYERKRERVTNALRRSKKKERKN